MGTTQSLPQCRKTNNYFCIIFTQPDEISLIDADIRVIDVVRKAIVRTWTRGLCKDEDDGGYWRFQLDGSPLAKNSSGYESYQGKVMACVILQDLLANGWRIELASDLCRKYINGSWFFVRSAPSAVPPRVLCVGLSGDDTLQLVNTPGNMVSVVREAITRTWRLGIQVDFEDFKGTGVKLRGNPWVGSQRDAVDARIMLLHIIRDLARHGWMLYVSSHLKDTRDALFFIYQSEGVAADMNTAWMLSLNLNDRLRLLEADHSVQEIVKRVVATNWYGIQEDCDYYGARELKLRGSPWWADGEETITSRNLIGAILQVLRQHGWYVLETIDMTRKLTNKSSFVFIRGQPDVSLHWCLSLHQTDVLRLVNAPVELVENLKRCLFTSYDFGVQNERMYSDAYEWKLCGEPWNGSTGVFRNNYHVHGHHLMVAILHAAAEQGWRPICSADISAKYRSNDGNENDEKLSVHSWWFCASASAAPSSPPTGAEASAPPFSEAPPSYSTAVHHTDQPPSYFDIK